MTWKGAGRRGSEAALLRREGESRESPATQVALIATGSAVEIYLCARPGRPEGDFVSQARSAYENLLRELRLQGVARRDVVAEKVFLSDIAAQLAPVRKIRKEFYRDGGSERELSPATTFVQQPPARPGQLCELQAFALLSGDGSSPVRRDLGSLPPGASGRIVEAGGLRHVFLAGVTGGRVGDSLDFPGQASAMFRNADACLRAGGLSFHNVLRTWIYLRDIDRDYEELNRTRSEFFRSRGLRTFPASTGIQGSPHRSGHGCALDLRAIDGNGRFDVCPIHAPTMNEAPAYGSDFSRGMRVELEDRSIIYVSGTASIDREGRVVALGDIEGQVDRMILNIERLLAGEGADLSHVVSAITYLKRREDLPVFLEAAHRRGFPPAIPNTVCVAGVCRPEWLCEMEAIAVLA